MLTATLYKSPNGDTEQIQVTNIHPDDANFFNHGGFQVSMETLMCGQFVVYATNGETDEDGEIIDLCHVVPQGEEYHVSMNKLRQLVENSLTN